MKIVLCNEDKVVMDIIENVNDIEIEDDCIKFDGGELRGLKCSPLILDDDVEISIGGSITSDIRELDKAQDYIKVDRLKGLEEAMEILLGVKQ